MSNRLGRPSPGASQYISFFRFATRSARFFAARVARSVTSAERAITSELRDLFLLPGFVLLDLLSVGLQEFRPEFAGVFPGIVLRPIPFPPYFVHLLPALFSVSNDLFHDVLGGAGGRSSLRTKTRGGSRRRSASRSCSRRWSAGHSQSREGTSRSTAGATRYSSISRVRRSRGASFWYTSLCSGHGRAESKWSRWFVWSADTWGQHCVKVFAAYLTQCARGDRCWGCL